MTKETQATKTIEDIWQKGFSSDPETLVPKLNQMYHKKGQNLVEKLKRMYLWNVRLLYIFAPLGALLLSLAGLPILGIGAGLLVLWIAVEARNPLREILALDTSDSVYTYITEFQRWYKRVVKRFTRVYRVFYPGFFVVGMVQMTQTEMGNKILSAITEKAPDAFSILGYHWAIWVLWLVGTAGLALAGGALFRLDMKMVYGTTQQRIDDLEADLAALSDDSTSD